MHLNHTVPAAIIGAPNDTNVYIGDTVMLTCIVFGVPLPKITWLKGNQHLANQSVSAAEVKATNLTFRKSTLQLCSVQLTDDSQYSCIADNSFSTAITTFNVNVKGKNFIYLFTLIVIIFCSICL